MSRRACAHLCLQLFLQILPSRVALSFVCVCPPYFSWWTTKVFFFFGLLTAAPWDVCWVKFFLWKNWVGLSSLNYISDKTSQRSKVAYSLVCVLCMRPISNIAEEQNVDLAIKTLWRGEYLCLGFNSTHPRSWWTISVTSCLVSHAQVWMYVWSRREHGHEFVAIKCAPYNPERQVQMSEIESSVW